MKRSHASSNCTDGESGPATKRSVAHSTFLKWRGELDKEFQTISWLDCEVRNERVKKVVTKLKCKACIRFESKIVGRRNYSNKWIVGADSVRTSNIKDHARTDQHSHAIMLLKKEQCSSAGLGPQVYAPIAQSLSVLSDDVKAKLRVKFDIAHFVATEKLAFSKYPQICSLEAHHGVDVGTSYTNEAACKTFCHYIAESKRDDLSKCLSRAKFFSILMDGSTDSGNIDDELFLVLWCDVDGSDEMVHSRMSYFTVARPEAVTGKGLVECMQGALSRLGIVEINSETCKFLVGIGTDGASANIAAAGMKGLVEKELPWVFWMWCLAHRLELAVQDALKRTTFDQIEEMLLRLYYLYERSPKKCRELEDVVADLRQFLTFDDKGIRPVRASGSRWVTHKVNAMKRVLSKYGAYVGHLTALSQDPSVKSVDQAKLHGYCKKWVDAKYVLGCAFFVDLLAPCAVFSKVMQGDDLDVLGAFTALIKTVKEVNKLCSKSLDQWPMYSATLKKVSKEDGKNVYQGQELHRYDAALSYFTAHFEEYCTSVTSCLKSRLAWSDLEMIRDVIVVLACQGWEKILNDEKESTEAAQAVIRLGSRFKTPLTSAGVETELLHEEFLEMISYADQFISIATLDYRAVWWRLYHSPNASSWKNILDLVRLLFTLPFSNGKLERVFSTLKLIKVDKRSSLGNEHLDDLLSLNINPSSVTDFNPDQSIQRWWEDKDRRPNQQPRQPYKKRTRHQESQDSESDDEDTGILVEWDKWLDN